nr:MAG TPA: hypothetical protein [Caudoviricetes sp.]
MLLIARPRVGGYCEVFNYFLRPLPQFLKHKFLKTPEKWKKSNNSDRKEEQWQDPEKLFHYKLAT